MGRQTVPVAQTFVQTRALVVRFLAAFRTVFPTSWSTLDRIPSTPAPQADPLWESTGSERICCFAQPTFQGDRPSAAPGGGQIWSKPGQHWQILHPIWRTSTEPAPNLVEFDQRRANFVASALIWPTRPKLGPSRSRIAPTWPMPHRSGLDLVELSPHIQPESAKNSPILTNLGRCRPELPQGWSQVVRSRPTSTTSGRGPAKSTPRSTVRFRLKSARIGQTSACLPSTCSSEGQDNAKNTEENTYPSDTQTEQRFDTKSQKTEPQAMAARTLPPWGGGGVSGAARFPSDGTTYIATPSRMATPPGHRRPRTSVATRTKSRPMFKNKS